MQKLAIAFHLYEIPSAKMTLHSFHEGHHLSNATAMG